MSHVASNGDGDGDGIAVSSPLASPSRASLMARSLFASLDGDGDGWLRRSDLAAFIEDEGKLDEIANIMDPQHTGRIDLQAFERCFDMFGADDDDMDDMDEQQQGEEEEAADSAAPAPAPAPAPVVKAPAPRRHVSFGEADAAARVSVSGTSRSGISIPPAGAKKAAIKTQNSNDTLPIAHVAPCQSRGLERRAPESLFDLSAACRCRRRRCAVLSLCPPQ